MSGTYAMTPEQRLEWEAEVRSLYDGMVRIVVTPTWAKLICGAAVSSKVRQEMSRWDVENPRAAPSPK